MPEFETPADKVEAIINSRPVGYTRPWTHEEIAEIDRIVYRSRMGSEYGVSETEKEKRFQTEKPTVVINSN